MTPLRKIFLSLILALTLAALPTFSRDEAQSAVYKRTYGYTHLLREHTLLDGSAHCSSTAIGPHALLTASHCEMPTDVIDIDGVRDIQVVAVLRDKHDHTIYLVDATFDSYASFSTDKVYPGDEGFIWGNPGGHRDVLRKGYVVSAAAPEDEFGPTGPTEIMYDMNGYHGDSGAAVFNNAGEIVAIISVADIIESRDDAHDSMKLMGCIVLDFSAVTLAKAVAFVPEK